MVCRPVVLLALARLGPFGSALLFCSAPRGTGVSAVPRRAFLQCPASETPPTMPTAAQWGVVIDGCSDVSTEASDVMSDPGDFDLIRRYLVGMYVNTMIRKPLLRALTPHLVACLQHCRALLDRRSRSPSHTASYSADAPHPGASASRGAPQR